MTNDEASNYDTPWKEVVNKFFEDFLAFFFPVVYEAIDWNVPYRTLDTELEQITRNAETGKRLADKLVEIKLLTGQPIILLIHIEVQSQFETNFAKRIYIYNHRIFDRYNQEVLSLVVLGDNSRTWRPSQFGYNLFGFQTSIQFPIVKLLDYEAEWEQLENNSNKIAIIVMAHVKTITTYSNLDLRKQWKLNIIRGLYQKGYRESWV